MKDNSSFVAFTVNRHPTQKNLFRDNNRAIERDESRPPVKWVKKKISKKLPTKNEGTLKVRLQSVAKAHIHTHTRTVLLSRMAARGKRTARQISTAKKNVYIGWNFRHDRKTKTKSSQVWMRRGKKKNSLKWHHVKLGISFFSPKTSGKSHENSKLKNTRITVGLTMTLTAYADLKRGENSISMVINSSIFYFFLRKSTGWLPWHKIKKRYPKKPTMGVRSILAE